MGWRDGVSAVGALDELRDELLSLVCGWSDDRAAWLDDDQPHEVTTMTNKKAPRVRGGGLDARYWSASGEVTAATIRLLILGDLARRGDLDAAALDDAADNVRDRYEQLNATARELLTEQAGEGE